MKDTSNPSCPQVLSAQHERWQRSYDAWPEMFGEEPSWAARQAAGLLRGEGARTILELGCGQGRDTLFFLRQGFRVNALDYSEKGLDELVSKVQELGMTQNLRAACHDVRTPLPFESGTFDACFSHMLFCMAMTTVELERLSSEIHRVLKPGGLCVYTARHTHDPDYGTGIHHGEEIYELNGGFIVHFFDRRKIDGLAGPFEVLSVREFEEGDIPKRLFYVCLGKRRSPSGKEER